VRFVTTCRIYSRSWARTVDQGVISVTHSDI
jgi:hypothetical protein